MSFHVTSKGKGRKKFVIRGHLHNGRPVEFPATHDQKTSEHLRVIVESLNSSAQFGKLPDPGLDGWIKGLSPNEAARYVKAGLLDVSVLETERSLKDLLSAFIDECRIITPKRSTIDMKEWRIRRILSGLDPQAKLHNVSITGVTAALDRMVALSGKWMGQPLSAKSKREYVLAIKEFTAWVQKRLMAKEDPLSELPLPPIKGRQRRKRRPMSVEEFRKLIVYLRAAPDRYSHQQSEWTPRDRLMIYWVAVMTGFRMKELASLTPAHVDFDRDPVTVRVAACNSKNGEDGIVVIPAELATSLRQYTAGKLPESRLLQMPRGHNAMRRAFYRDLDAAGVQRIFADGTATDFHALRSTAICWWLTKNNLNALDAQHQARLTSLDLVHRYTKFYRPEQTKLVASSPKILAEASTPA